MDYRFHVKYIQLIDKYKEIKEKRALVIQNMSQAEKDNDQKSILDYQNTLAELDLALHRLDMEIKELEEDHVIISYKDK